MNERENKLKRRIAMGKVLKSKTILKRNPDLKLCSNHFKDDTPLNRVWASTAYRRMSQGTAYRDGKGWYRREK